MPDPASPPLVSVIIPAWNAAATIVETLESVRAQTFQEYEVIIVDDGSTDQTAEIVHRYCEADHRFSLWQQTNQGLATTRNVGLNHARGDFITFLDADDVWMPQKLTKQLELFEQEPRANLVFTNYFFWDGQKDGLLFFRADRPLPIGDVSQRVIAANPYIPSIVMVRRSLFATGCRFTPGLRRCEDWDLWLQFLEYGLWTHGTREPLVRYRQWEGNMSKQKLEMCETGLQVLETRLSQSKLPHLRPAYLRTQAFARAQLELVHARQTLESNPTKVAPFIWRAWCFYPRRLKWLLWWIAVLWPKWLGGIPGQNVVHKKLRAKF